MSSVQIPVKYGGCRIFSTPSILPFLDRLLFVGSVVRELEKSSSLSLSLVSSSIVEEKGDSKTIIIRRFIFYFEREEAHTVEDLPDECNDS